MVYSLVSAGEIRPENSISLVEFKHKNNFGLTVFKGEIYGKNGNVISTGYGSETLSDFIDFFEKAGIKSIGCALTALGIVLCLL